ncbi:hypothetical protein C8Q80DRAFT_681799 [Daedaleopsis nitida]|nr:hypothetical protein C8Q80DRAFT_681799 [Daedaleopsis nitida]
MARELDAPSQLVLWIGDVVGRHLIGWGNGSWANQGLRQTHMLCRPARRDSSDACQRLSDDDDDDDNDDDDDDDNDDDNDDDDNDNDDHDDAQLEQAEGHRTRRRRRRADGECAHVHPEIRSASKLASPRACAARQSFRDARADRHGHLRPAWHARRTPLRASTYAFPPLSSRSVDWATRLWHGPPVPVGRSLAVLLQRRRPSRSRMRHASTLVSGGGGRLDISILAHHTPFDRCRFCLARNSAIGRARDMHHWHTPMRRLNVARRLFCSQSRVNLQSRAALLLPVPSGLLPVLHKPSSIPLR